MTGDDFLKLAGKLAVTFHEPASCRTAVGRAYYGGFHLAKAFLEGLGIKSPRNANTHVYIQHCLLNSGNPELATAGLVLNNLHSDRIKADYDLSSSPVESAPVARASVERAHQIQSALQKFGGEDQRQMIRASIESYLAKLQSSRSP